MSQFTIQDRNLFLHTRFGPVRFFGWRGLGRYFILGRGFRRCFIVGQSRFGRGILDDCRHVRLVGGAEQGIERRLRFALGRFASRIRRLRVRLTDVNGPRGGLDKRCRIAVDLIPRGMVMVEGAGDDPFALVAGAAKRASRAVRRALERRRRGRNPRV